MLLMVMQCWCKWAASECEEGVACLLKAALPVTLVRCSGEMMFPITTTWFSVTQSNLKPDVNGPKAPITCVVNKDVNLKEKMCSTRSYENFSQHYLCCSVVRSLHSCFPRQELHCECELNWDEVRSWASKCCRSKGGLCFLQPNAKNMGNCLCVLLKTLVWSSRALRLGSWDSKSGPWRRLKPSPVTTQQSGAVLRRDGRDGILPIWWLDTLPEMARWVATNAGRMARDACHQIMSTDGFDGYQQINWIPTEDRFQSLSLRCIAKAMHMFRAI